MPNWSKIWLYRRVRVTYWEIYWHGSARSIHMDLLDLLTWICDCVYSECVVYWVCYLSLLAIVWIVHEVEGSIRRIISQTSNLIAVLPLHTHKHTHTHIHTHTQRSVRSVNQTVFLYWALLCSFTELYCGSLLSSTVFLYWALLRSFTELYCGSLLSSTAFLYWALLWFFTKLYCVPVLSSTAFL